MPRAPNQRKAKPESAGATSSTDAFNKLFKRTRVSDATSKTDGGGDKDQASHHQSCKQHHRKSKTGCGAVPVEDVPEEDVDDPSWQQPMYQNIQNEGEARDDGRRLPFSDVYKNKILPNCGGVELLQYAQIPVRSHHQT